MLPELGHFALIIGLLCACLQSITPLYGVAKNSPVWMETGRSLAFGQFFFIFVAFLILANAFVQDDFSVKYVAGHSNTLLPVYYKISAVWGGHEGSLLLWALTLAGWTIAVAIFSKQLPREMLARVLAVMGMISIGFLLFILLTSNPFDRLLPNTPLEGSDLNPLLQDFGLIVHPPMLYMGYVGFSVAFAFAIAALLGGSLDSAWARWSRPWTIVAWAFLTLGIALGSWWAYYELGWGGWWFWDPVENASFMPWLVGTALMHSLAVTEKRGAFKSWTVFLAIIAFSLSLLGTFLVRSGVLTSVHAFASDPSRGSFVLALLGITMIVSLGLYAWRAPDLVGKSEHKLLSRESFLLGNNIVLVVAWITVMIGTLYPLVLDFIGAGKLSIGPPYFNAVFSPLMAILAVLLGFGLVANWKSTEPKGLVKKLRVVAVVSVVLTLVFTAISGIAWDWISMLAILLGLWVALITLNDLRKKAVARVGNLKNKLALGSAYYAMVLGHLGFALMIVGATIVSLHSVERDVRIEIGQKVVLGQYELHFASLHAIQGPNYEASRINVEVLSDGQVVSVLKPEKRVYFSQANPMTEAGIDPGLLRDVYVAIGEELDGGAWAVRVQYKPLIRWIWLGAIFMFIAGGLAVFDKRYRPKEKVSQVVMPSNSEFAK
ncbi:MULTISPECIES: heme lyase CcmF/NrfE family subunit [unclassified Oleiphilus]|nr:MULTISPECIES: heme lyase CcmF/NrfE family subunit [unclassified Oleiphilus]KZY65042.1 c-type cytochrome biogenesis protein CcmF [Oleiphilus sp. HI0066]KZY71423.1 c-type cytochrome biogenesis protein CcmF [Oleiphilus sp. HI0067]